MTRSYPAGDYKKKRGSPAGDLSFCNTIDADYRPSIFFTSAATVAPL